MPQTNRSKPRPKTLATLTADTRARLDAMVEATSANAVGRRLGIGGNTIRRAQRGEAMLPVIVELVTLKLAAAELSTANCREASAAA